MSTTVAVLGAGPSGLVAAKEALANGLVPTIFEKQAELGGVWNPQTGAVWDTMRTNISKFTTVYGDRQYPNDTEMFPSSSSVFSYLNDYADEFKLRDLIKFQSEVVRVEPMGNANGASGWNVTWRANATSSGVLEQSQTFDGVIVATGIFAKANVPNLPGLESFPGKILHSNEYKTGKEFEGKNVLIIGGSFSGAEIAADVSTHSKQSYHTFRRRFWVLRRYLPDHQEKNGSLIPIDLLFYNRKFYSQKTRANNDEETEESILTKKNTNLLSFCQEQQKFKQLEIPKEDFKISINSVISDNYLPQIENGSLVPIMGSIKEIQGRTVHFQDGQTLLDVDVLIFGTGFQMDNSFFPKAVLDKLKYDPRDGLQPLILFQECVHPDLAGLFFVGMYKGPYFAMMEQQARFACRVLAKIIMLPSKEVIEEGLRKEEEIRNQTLPRPQFPHPEYVLFADTMSGLANSFPNLDKLLSPNESLAAAFGQTRPSGALIMMEHRKAEIARRFMSEPVTPSHYNFVHSPKQTLNQMDFVQQVLKLFENT